MALSVLVLSLTACQNSQKSWEAAYDEYPEDLRHSIEEMGESAVDAEESQSISRRKKEMYDEGFNMETIHVSGIICSSG